MPDRLFGLPAHPLLVHIPVVLLPLCALLAIVFVVRLSLTRQFGLPVVMLTAVAAGGTFFAAESGEGMEKILNEPPNPALEAHAEWGDRIRIAAIVFFVIALIFVLLARRSSSSSSSSSSTRASTAAASGTGGVVVESGRSTVVMVLAALLVVSALGTTYAVIETGHSGAKQAWEDAGKEG
jgi:uncharacterized membrane protein